MSIRQSKSTLHTAQWTVAEHIEIVCSKENSQNKWITEIETTMRDDNSVCLTIEQVIELARVLNDIIALDDNG